MKNGRTDSSKLRPGARPRLFISYRRRSDSHAALLLKDRLTRAFGEGTAFRDVDDIGGGEAFPETIREAVESCDAFLLLVSPGWVELIEELHKPEDFVRREIAAALARDVLLIPLLLGGATMPKPEELPEEIRALAFRNALELSDSRWDYDVERLVKLIRKRFPPPAPFFQSGVRTFRSFLGTFPGTLLVIAAVLFAGVFGLGYAIWNRFLRADFDACVRANAPDWRGAEATIRVGTYDSAFVKTDEYAAALKHSDAAKGIPLVLRVSDSEGVVGAVFFRFFRADKVEDSVFRVQRVLRPPCVDVQDYTNSSLPHADKSFLKNWNKLAVRLGERDYVVRPDDRGDYITATLEPAPADLELPWKK